MNEYLVISALGKDRPGIVNALSKAVFDAGGNITESRMAVLGGEFALILMIAGTPVALECIERALPELEQSLGLTTITRRTTARAAGAGCVPYLIKVVAMDHPGIVHDVAGFFSSRDLNIEELNTGTYAAPHTGTPMFSLEMTVSVPAETPVGPLREAFLNFCDELNLDAAFEPLKG